MKLLSTHNAYLYKLQADRLLKVKQSMPDYIKQGVKGCLEKMPQKCNFFTD